jgi:hypothetical protein
MDELDPKQKLVFSEPLHSLAESCCVVCVPECCGVDAYEISAKHMVPWINAYGLSAANKALSQLQSMINWAGGQEGRIWSDGQDLNAIWYPAACVNYLENWRRELITALAMVTGSFPTSA